MGGAAGAYSVNYEFNDNADEHGERNTYAIDTDIAHGGRAAGDKILVELVCTGVKQAEAEGAQRRKEGARGSCLHLDAPKRCGQKVGREPHAEIQEDVREVAYFKPCKDDDI